MTQTIAESEILTDYWKFWLWQYTCRNPEYCLGFKEYSKALMPPWVITKAEEILHVQLTPSEIEALLLTIGRHPLRTSRLFWKIVGKNNPWIVSTKIHEFRWSVSEWWDRRINDFHRKFRCHPKDPKKDCDSRQILNEVLKKNPPKQSDFYPDIFDPDIFLEGEDPFFTYVVDTQKPLDQIIAEVTYGYNLYRNPNTQGERQKAYFKLVKELFARSSPRLNIDNQIRAIGLAVWDAKNGRAKRLPKKISIHEAAKGVYREFNLRKHGYKKPIYGESSLRKFQRLYNRTEECIKRRSVLPMK